MADEYRSDITIAFSYRNAKGEESQHILSNWRENGHYLQGWCSINDGFRTFRKDRVLQYLSSAELLLSNPFPPKATIPKEKRQTEQLPQILFTGFPAAQRADLERRAAESGLDVRKSVTQSLNYLCYGPNAGPTKVSKAMEQSVYIMNQAQFFALLETGELPEEHELTV